MEIIKKEISTPEEYTDLVRSFVTLLDAQLKAWEKVSEDSDDLHGLAQQMPQLISLVNTVGYFRGQDGAFLDFRPRTDNQSELYGYEKMFEERLDKLIDVLMASDEKDYYMSRIESYFVKSRTKQKPTVW